jgi:hypothetical protein
MTEPTNDSRTLRMRLSNGHTEALEFTAPEDPRGFALCLSRALRSWRIAHRTGRHYSARGTEPKRWEVEWRGAQIHFDAALPGKPAYWALVGESPCKIRTTWVGRPEGWDHDYPASIIDEDAAETLRAAAHVLNRIGRAIEDYDKISAFLVRASEALGDCVRTERAQRLIASAFGGGNAKP